jgi:cytochrome c-type biogenesis protein CcmE
MRFKPKHQRMALIIFALLVALIGVWQLMSVFRSNLVFFYTPTELETHVLNPKETVRIGGLVKEGSLIKHQDEVSIEFILTDGKHELRVLYKGLIPALFREGQGMVAKGKRSNKELFIAEELLAKHDENYMPPEVAKGLKKQGYWQEPNKKNQ